MFKNCTKTGPSVEKFFGQTCFFLSWQLGSLISYGCRILRSTKWFADTLDPEVLLLYAWSTISIEDNPSFEDSVDRHFDSLLKSTFALTGPAIQLAIVTF